MSRDAWGLQSPRRGLMNHSMVLAARWSAAGEASSALHCFLVQKPTIIWARGVTGRITLNRITLAAVAICAAFTPVVSSAATLFESVPDFTAGISDAAYCSTCDEGEQVVGQQFTLESSSIVKSISFVMRDYSGESINQASVGIFSDSNNGVIGDTVFSRTFNISEFDSIEYINDYDRLITITLGEIALSGSYSVFLSGPGGGLIPYYNDFGGGIFTDVSQPSGAIPGTTYRDTFSALGVRLSGDMTAAVPEPATWAMMIIGFGMVGLAMRRRPKVAFRLS